MNELVFATTEEAFIYLANALNKKVVIAKKKEVKNPRIKPKNKSEEKNWNNSSMWGDPKNHKYPLFNSSGNLDIKKCKSALRYLNMPRSKKSYPNNKERGKVLSKIIKAIFKLDSKAKIKYQAKDKMYRDLPQSLKKKMSGFEGKNKEATMSIDLEALDEQLRIAEEGPKSISKILESLKSLTGKNSAIMSKHLDELGMTAQDLTRMRLKNLPQWMYSVLAEAGIEDGIDEEDSIAACMIAAEAKEIKDDLFAIIKKSNSNKMDKQAKLILGITNLGSMTMAELIDLIRDSVAKSDEDISVEEVAAAEAVAE